MGYKCCVPGCRSGYAEIDSRRKNIEHAKYLMSSSSACSVSMFKFPTIEKWRAAWLKSIRREIIDENGKRLPFVPTRNHRVCSMHFDKNDFVNESEDTHTTRKAKKSALLVKKLKTTAVPHIFPSFPTYLQANHSSNVVSTKCTAEQRYLRASEKLVELETEMHVTDTVKSIVEIEEKLKDTCIPSDFVGILRGSAYIFMLIPNLEAEEPKSVAVDCVIRVAETLSVEVYVKNSRLPKNLFNHVLCKSETISSMTELCNLLSVAKSFCDLEKCSDPSGLIEFAIHLIKRYLNDSKDEDEQDSHAGLLRFICEQLYLCQQKSHARHYTPEMITLAFMWCMTSKSLYTKLRELFILPTVRRLQQLSEGTSVTTGTVQKTYLRQRSATLKEDEKIVILLIDEVYAAQRVEMVNGRIIGMTENGAVAKTVLTFMVQSIRSKYKDVIKIVPVESLTIDILKKHFYSVLQDIADIFITVAVCVDNHVVNR